ncbi:DUF6223 family protein [Dactylosporangium darangshiense]|uniref:Uncharacterized protein n=1 Tax=Dactylosporangium darangshiense TaxID=579108 RepID=A0ABP8DSC6_9ACTN
MDIHLLYAASTVGAHTLTLDRLVATAAALAALAAAVVGALTLMRRLGRFAKRGPAFALVAGAAGAVVGGLVLATADGGPGTGNGVVGAAAAVVLGLLAVVFGALTRFRIKSV